MGSKGILRRNLLSQGLAGGACAALAAPGCAAAQAVGVKVGDLPDLTIKEVKVYVVGSGRPGTAVTNAGYARIAAVATQSGIENGALSAARSVLESI